MITEDTLIFGLGTITCKIIPYAFRFAELERGKFTPGEDISGKVVFVEREMDIKPADSDSVKALIILLHMLKDKPREQKVLQLGEIYWDFVAATNISIDLAIKWCEELLEAFQMAIKD